MKLDVNKKVVFWIGGGIGALGVLLSILAISLHPVLWQFTEYSQAGFATVGGLFALLISLGSLGFSGYKGHLVAQNKSVKKNDEMISIVLTVLSFSMSVAAIACGA